MKKSIRRQTILQLIRDAGDEQLSTKELAQKLNVSEATIRRDLNELADAGHIQRQHGGAQLNPRPVVPNKGQIGLLFGSRIDKFRDPFYNLVLEGVDRKLHECGYRSAYVRTFFDVQTTEQAKDLLKNFPVQGIIVIGTSYVDSIQYLQDNAPQIVTISHDHENYPDVVRFDGKSGMRALVEHVLEHGYRRLGFISGGKDPRLTAFMEAHEAHNLPIVPELIRILDGNLRGWFPKLGEEGARQLMSLSKPPDAIICASDRLAIGAMHWLQQAGYRIPQDIAVTGFDNIPDSEFTFPSLTTVHVHKELIGELAAERLVRRIENPDEVPLHIIVPTSLVIRQSCGHHD